MTTKKKGSKSRPAKRVVAPEGKTLGGARKKASAPVSPAPDVKQTARPPSYDPKRGAANGSARKGPRLVEDDREDASELSEDQFFEEVSLRDMAGRAARSVSKMFGDAKQMAGPTARRVGEFFEEAKEKAGPTARNAAEATKKVAVDLEGGLDEAFGKISEQARDLMSKGQHTRVRIKFRGRQITELPIGVVAAAEVASLWWFGPLRLLLGHVVGKTVLDVEFVSNADAHVAEGRAQMADGELDKALAAFDKALSMDRRSAAAWLGRGVALKLRGDRAGAKAAFEKAEECDAHGEPGREARRHLDNLAEK